MKLQHLAFHLLLLLFASSRVSVANKRELKLDTLSSLSKLNQRYLANLTRSDYSTASSSQDDDEDYIDENEDTTTTTTTTTTTSFAEEHTDNLDESKDETLYEDNETNNNDYEEDDAENTEDDLDDTTSQSDPYNCPSQCKCKFNKLEHKTENNKPDESLDETDYEDDDSVSKRQVTNEYEQDLANEKYRIDVDCSASNLNTIRNLFDEEFPLDQIVKFNLSSNKFRALRLDDGFEDLTSLEELDVSRNSLLKSLSPRNFLKKFRHLKRLNLESLPQINCDSSSDYSSIDCKWFKTLIYLHKRNISVDLTKCDLNQLSAQSGSIVSRCFGGGGGSATNQKKTSNLIQIDSVVFELKLEPELDQILIDGDTLELACRFRKQSKTSSRKSTDLTNRVFLESHLKWFVVTNELTLSELKPGQFNIFETNHRVRNDLLIDSKLLVKNAKSNQHSGKYFCSTWNQLNSKLDGLNTSSVEITILNKNNEYFSSDLAKTKMYCAETVTTTYKGKYKWSKTLAGSKSKQKCLTNNRDAYYVCDSQGRWSSAPSLDECAFESNLTRFLQHLTKLDARNTLKLVSNISLDDLIHKLVAFQSGDINPYDILYIQRFLIASHNRSRAQQRQLIWLNDLISKLTVLNQAKRFDHATFFNYFTLGLIPNLVSKLGERAETSLNGSDLVLSSNYLSSALITSSMLNKSMTNESLVCYLEKYSLTQQIYFRCYLTDQPGLKQYTTRVELSLTNKTNSMMFLLFENANMFPILNETKRDYSDLTKQNRLIEYDLNDTESEETNQIFAFISSESLTTRLNLSLEIKMPTKYYRLLARIESKLARLRLSVNATQTSSKRSVNLFELDKNPFDEIFSQLEYHVVNSVSSHNLTQDDLDDLELNDTVKLKQFRLSLTQKWFNIHTYELVYFNSSSNKTNCSIVSLEQQFKLFSSNTFKIYAKLACQLEAQANLIHYISIRNEAKSETNHSFKSNEVIEMIDQYMREYNLNEISLFRSIYSTLNTKYTWFKHKIVYFASFVSFLMLFVTLVTYFVSRRSLLMPRSFYHVFINIWLSVSLLIVTFSLSVSQINIAYVCLPASLSLHYLTLCASCWHTLYFYCLFSKLNTLKKRNYNLIFNLTSDKKEMVYKELTRKKKSSEVEEDEEEEEEEVIEKPVIHLYMLGYGLPLLLCSIIVSITKRDYLSVPFTACFTNETNILVGSVILPVVVMFLVKLCFICLVVFTLKRIINDLKKDNFTDDFSENNNTQGELKVSKLQMCQKWTNEQNEAEEPPREVDLLNESKERTSLAAQSNIYSERTSVMDTQHKPNLQLKFAFVSLVIYLIGWTLGALLATTPVLTKRYFKSNSWDHFSPVELQMNDLLKKIFSYLFACTLIVYSMMQISFYLLSRDDVYVYKRTHSSYFNRKRIRFSLVQMCFNRGKLRQMSESSSSSSSSDHKQNDVVTIEGIDTKEGIASATKEEQNWYYETNQQQIDQSPPSIKPADLTEHRESICDVLFSAKKQSPSTVSLKSEVSQEEEPKSSDILMPTLATQEEEETSGELEENPYSKLHAHTKKPSHVRNPSLLDGSITQNIQILNGSHYLQDTSLNKLSHTNTNRSTKVYKKPPYVFVDYKYEEKMLKSSKLNDLLINSCSVNTGTAIDSIPDMIDMSGIKSLLSETTTQASCFKNKMAHSNGSDSATPSLSVSSSNTVSSLNFINNIAAADTVTHVTATNENNVYSNRSSQLSTLMIYQSLKKTQQQQQPFRKLELNHETSV